MTRRCIPLPVLVVCISSFLTGQQRRELQVSDTVSVTSDDAVAQQHSLAFAQPVKCGSDGRMFVRFAFGSIEPGVSAISGDGKKISRFSLEQVPNLQQSTVHDFAPGPQGEVYLLISKQEKRGGPVDHYVVRFDGDGKYRATAKLDNLFQPRFRARQMAVFVNGNFVISGYEHGTSRPITAIFGSDGHLLKEISLSDDVGVKDITKSEQDLPNQSPEEQLGFMLDSTWLQSADDGNVYLMRDTPSGPVDIVSPGGNVRKLLLKPPLQGRFLSVKVDAGRIVAEYTLPPAASTDARTVVFVITDSSTGKTIGEYESKDPRIGAAMLCYANRSFTFLALGAGSGLQLVTVSLQ